MKRTTKLLFMPVLSLVLSACMDLRHVSELAVESGDGLKVYESLEPDFKTICDRHCKLDKLQSGTFDLTPCVCSQSEKADSITLLIYKSLYNYFSGLAKLSNDELTDYNSDELVAALTETNFGDITINRDQADSYARIGKIVLKAFTDEYRRKKLKTYVVEADQPVTVLLNFLDLNVKNLRGKINVLSGKYKAYYFDISTDTSVSEFDKRTAFEDYFEISESLDRWKTEINKYSEALVKIKEGHNELVRNIDKLKEEDVRAVLSRYAGDIEDIKTEINKLKSH